MQRINKLTFIFSIIAISIFSASLVKKTFQNDTYFTIAVGNKILSEGIYTDETFTFHEGLKYENVRWIFDITIAKIYNLYGFLGIYVFVMIMSAIIGSTIFYILIKQNNSLFNSLILSLIVIYLSRGVLAARAQIISFLIFILEYYYIYMLLATNKKRYLILLVLLSVLLANVHASVYPLFYAFFLPYFAELILYKILKKDGIDNKIIIEKKDNIIVLFYTMIICILGGFITPIGFAPFINMFKTVGEVSTDIIAEMKPLDLYSSKGFIIYICTFIGIVGFSKIKANIVDCFYLLGFGLLSLSSIRSIYFFYLIGIFPISHVINEFFKNYSFKISTTKIQYYFLFAIVFILVICFSTSNFSNKLLEYYVSTKDYPVDASEYIKNNINISTMRLYNHFNNGSYLEFCGIPVFIDSRAEIYLNTFNDTNILEDWSISNESKKYKTIFDKYGITHALLYNESKIVDYISEDKEWEKIYQDDSFVIYEKNNNI